MIFNFQFLKQQNSPSDRYAGVSLAITTILCLVITFYALENGQFIVFQNFYYVPIILACVYFSLRGIVFSMALSAVYLFFIMSYTSEAAIIQQALTRVCISMLVAGVVAYLSLLSKRSQDKLQENEHLLSRIVQGSPIPMFVIGKDHRVIHWNKALETMSRVSAEDVTGTNRQWLAFYNIGRPCLADLIIDEAIDGMSKWYNGKCKRSNLLEEACEITDFFPDVGENGQWIHLTAALIRDASGNVIGALETLEDVSEQKYFEEKLRESETRYRNLVETTPDIIYEVDKQGRFTYVNPRMTKVLGLSSDEMMGKPFTTILPPEVVETTIERFRRARRGEEISLYETDLVSKDGPLAVEFNVISLIDGQGKFAGRLGVGRDIVERLRMQKERKMLESRLLDAQKMESVGVMAGGIAHSFNNILAAMIGYTEMALDETSDTQRRLYLDQVLKSCERSGDLIKQLLTFSRKADQIKKPQNIQGIVAEGMKILQATVPSSISVHSDIKANNTMVLANATQIHQIMINLCNNAVQAMHDRGGVLDVSLECLNIETPDTLSLSPKINAGSYIRLAMKDSGIGISSAVMPKIFDPFFTTRDVSAGTGLGLSVVYGIIKNHGGAITVQSEPDKGSLFSVYLPVMDHAERRQKAHQSS